MMDLEREMVETIRTLVDKVPAPAGHRAFSVDSQGIATEHATAQEMIANRHPSPFASLIPDDIEECIPAYGDVDPKEGITVDAPPAPPLRIESDELVFLAHLGKALRTALEESDWDDFEQIEEWGDEFSLTLNYLGRYWHTENGGVWHPGKPVEW